jgi:mRNA interferase YafQ
MLSVEYGSQFKRDYKRCKKKHLPLEELHEVIKLVAENSPEALKILRQRHNMHSLKGDWKGSHECHVANFGDWLVVWTASNNVAFFERTGTHEEIFR